MRARWRKLVLGLVIAFLFLLSLEGVARIVWGTPDAPILVRRHMEIGAVPFTSRGDQVSPSFQGMDLSESFSATPAAGTRRIMVFGGSSVRAGSKLSLAQEFPALLEARLQEKGQDVEVLNLGRPGVDSHHLVPLVRAALPYQPAQVLLYLGHNDLGNALMEARYGTVSGAVQGRLRVLLHRLRIYHLLSDAISASSDGGVTTTAAVRRLHTAETPLTAGQRLMLEADFRTNLRAIARAVRASGTAELTFITPISNAAFPPTGAACPEILSAYHRQGRLDTRRLALAEVESALRQSPGCAELLHARGVLRGGLAGASDLIAARDADPLPMRATSRMVDILRDVAEEESVRLLDLVAWSEGVSGTAPERWFVDNLHLSTEGHVAVAQFIATAELKRSSIPGADGR